MRRKSICPFYLVTFAHLQGEEKGEGAWNEGFWTLRILQPILPVRRERLAVLVQ